MFVDKFEKQSKNVKMDSLKKEWLETTTKFLKGKPYQDLEWEFSEGIFIEPYYTKDETETTNLSYLDISKTIKLH